MADQGGGGAVPAGWYADPQGRHEQRYFDGAAWTEHVSTGGVATTDGGQAAPGLTGAALYGSPASPYAAIYGGAPAGMAGRGAYGGGRPAPARYENRAGLGLWIYLAGLVLAAVSMALPWLGSQGLFDIRVVNTGADTIDLPAQLVGSMIWAVLWMVLTCLPFQPGKLLGFLGAGCIGLLVCWTRLDNNSPSKRSNGLGVFVLILHLIVLWATLLEVRHESVLPGVSFGLGPFVATVAYVVMMVGAGVGRQRVRIDAGR